MPETDSSFSLPDLSEKKTPEKKRPSRRGRMIRRVIAAFLGLTAGVGAIELDRQATGGLFTNQVRSVVTNPEYLAKLWDSLNSGEIGGDIADLFQAADEARAKSVDGTSGAPEDLAELEHSQIFAETLPIADAFLGSYFSHYEIRSVFDGETGPKRALYLAEVDHPTIVDFNVGTAASPLYDPWVTAEQIGPFVTLPTNQSHSDTAQRTHALYSAYSNGSSVVEYPDVNFEKQGRDPRAIRAGALVLFSDDGQNRLAAYDSADFDLRMNDHTSDGEVIAIESFAASISSANEAADINSLQQLIGTSGLPEYSRENYESVTATYTFEDGTFKTLVFGLYTDPSELPSGVEAWSIRDQLSPQDFYSLVSQYGQEQQAESWVMLVPDPGPSSYLFDQAQVMGDVTRKYHSNMFIRPEYSLVQSGNR